MTAKTITWLAKCKSCGGSPYPLRSGKENIIACRNCCMRSVSFNSMKEAATDWNNVAPIEEDIPMKASTVIPITEAPKKKKKKTKKKAPVTSEPVSEMPNIEPQGEERVLTGADFEPEIA